MAIRREEEQVVKLPTERFCSTASTSGDIVHVYKNDKKRKGSINIYNEDDKVKMEQ